MAKQFSDFSFCGKRISDLLNIKYISVEYDSDQSKSLGLERDMQKGESTRYRIEPNYFYDTWSAPLEFDLHILKDTCKYQTQTEMEITKSELREITRWLTSSHYPEWIRFSDEDGNLEEWRYKGWFSNVETFVAYGTVYGLKLHFKCTTSFAWTDVITNSCACTTYKNMLVKNDGDDLNDYSYPTIRIHPTKDEEIFICNESDYTLLENGKISVASDDVFNTIIDKAENYAKLNGYDLEYTGKGAFNIVSICNDTGVQFKLIDNYGRVVKEAWTDEDGIEHQAETEKISKEVPCDITTVILEKPSVSEELDNVKSIVGIVNPNNMTLDEFKDYYKTQIGKECIAAIENGVDVQTTLGKKHFSYTIEDQSNVKDLIIAAIFTDFTPSLSQRVLNPTSIVS